MRSEKLCVPINITIQYHLCKTKLKFVPTKRVKVLIYALIILVFITGYVCINYTLNNCNNC